MISQYHIISECMQVLAHTRMRPLDKLRIEIHLIQMKRYLLGCDSTVEITSGPFTEENLRGVFWEITGLCNCRDDNPCTGPLISRLAEIADLISTFEPP